MLVLSRKIGEQIVIPQCGLSVTVVAVNGKTVRLAIAAPDAIDIYRSEVWERCQTAGSAFGQAALAEEVA